MDYSDPLVAGMVARDHVPMETITEENEIQAITVSCTFDGQSWPCEIISEYRDFTADAVARRQQTEAVQAADAARAQFGTSRRGDSIAGSVRFTGDV